jgi:hypothetical protein
MEIWRYGYGYMGIWRYGTLDFTFDLFISRRVRVMIWRYGDMEIWRYGDMEIWYFTLDFTFDFFY